MAINDSMPQLHAYQEGGHIYGQNDAEVAQYFRTQGALIPFFT